MVIRHTDSGAVVKAYGADNAVELSSFYDPIPISPTVALEESNGVIYNKATSAGATPRYRLSVLNSVLGGVTHAVIDEALATIDGDTLTAEQGATGFVRVVTSATGRAAISNSFAVSQTGSAISYTINYFSAGTHGKIAFDEITSKLAEGGDLEYYNGSTYASAAAQPGGIQRNLNCWGAGYDLSGVAVSHLSGGFLGGGALITPRHYVCSNHYAPGNKVGMTLRFVGNDGTIHTRTVQAQTTGSELPSIANPTYDVGDVCVFLLSSALPASVTPYPVVGDWFDQSVLLSVDAGVGSYVQRHRHCYITTNQNRHVLFSTATGDWLEFEKSTTPEVVSVRGFTFNAKPYPGCKISWGPRYSEDTSYQSAAIVGDSGSPVFVATGSNGLALCSHFTTPDQGPYLHAGLLNAMILEVDDRAGISTSPTVTVAPDPTL